MSLRLRRVHPIRDSCDATRPRFDATWTSRKVGERARDCLHLTRATLANQFQHKQRQGLHTESNPGESAAASVPQTRVWDRPLPRSDGLRTTFAPPGSSAWQRYERAPRSSPTGETQRDPALLTRSAHREQIGFVLWRFGRRSALDAILQHVPPEAPCLIKHILQACLLYTILESVKRARCMR